MKTLVTDLGFNNYGTLRYRVSEGPQTQFCVPEPLMATKPRPWVAAQVVCGRPRDTRRVVMRNDVHAKRGLLETARRHCSNDVDGLALDGNIQSRVSLSKEPCEHPR